MVYWNVGMVPVDCTNFWRWPDCTSWVGCMISQISSPEISFSSKTLINIHARFHAMGSRKALVWISAAILDVISYIRMMYDNRNVSCIQTMLIPCDRSMCLMVGFFPLRMTAIIAWLSSWKTIWGSFPATIRHKSTTGTPIVRSAKSAATISASGVEWLTHPCRLLAPATGNRVCLPWITMWAPEVERRESSQPAKSASA